MDGCWHVLLAAQHPLGQDVLLQKHSPLMHCWPGKQGGPIPHPQLPFAPQVSVVSVRHDRQLAPFEPQ